MQFCMECSKALIYGSKDLYFIIEGQEDQGEEAKGQHAQNV